MTQIDTSRRGFLKSAVAASAAMMSAAAVHAGIPAKSVACLLKRSQAVSTQGI